MHSAHAAQLRKMVALRTRCLEIGVPKGAPKHVLSTFVFQLLRDASPSPVHMQRLKTSLVEGVQSPLFRNAALTSVISWSTHAQERFIKISCLKIALSSRFNERVMWGHEVVPGAFPRLYTDAMEALKAAVVAP